MNRYDWNNPPPPGTEFDPPDEDSNFSSQKNDSTRGSDQGSNQIDIPVKNPVTTSSEIGEIELSAEKTRMRSRSTSVDRRRRRKRSRSYSRRSRSYSKDRRRRSRSRSKHRRRKRSPTRSRSRSASYRRRYRKHGRRHSRSRSRSRTHSRRNKSHRSKTHSRSHSRSRSYRSDRDKKSPKSKHSENRKANNYIDKELDGDIVGEEDMKIEEGDEEALAEQDPDTDQGPIPFKNDGSFLEMFKKMQEQQKAKEEPPQEAITKKPILPTFGKRRGGKVLKTGMVAKVRNIEEDSNNAQDAWSVYMKEVRKYKEVHCDDDSKTRPLVK